MNFQHDQKMEWIVYEIGYEAKEQYVFMTLRNKNER